MTINEFENYLSKLVSHILFSYNGKECGIDPISHNHYDMWYGNKFKTVNSISEVLNIPFFEEHSLIEIFDKITEIE